MITKQHFYLNHNLNEATMKNLILIICILICSACSNEGSKSEVAMQVDLAGPNQEQPKNAPKLQQPAEGAISRKLIKEGSIEFETTDIEKTRKQVLAAVASNQAYVSSDQQDKFSDRIQYTLIIRVPAARFDAFLASATEGVTYFDNKKINVKDVTADYLDSEARLKTKREIEARYLQLLRSASKVTDILNIEKELGAIRTEIESAEGQLKYLKDQVQYSTIQIGFYKSDSAHELFSYQIRHAFAQGWDNLRSFSVLMIGLWPFILIAIAVYMIFKRVARRKKGIKVVEKPVS